MEINPAVPVVVFEGFPIELEHEVPIFLLGLDHSVAPLDENAAVLHDRFTLDHVPRVERLAVEQRHPFGVVRCKNRD